MKSYGATIALALFFGGFGAHKFYLNQPGLGILYLLFCWTLIPGFIALIEIIVMLINGQSSFDRKYNGTTA